MIYLSPLNIELLGLYFLLLSGVNSHVLERGDVGTAADAGGMDKKPGTVLDTTKLEDFLSRSKQELDRMLLCNKIQ